MGAMAIFLKFYFESVWQNYKNPVAFYKIIVQRQVEAGMIDADDLTENFKIESPSIWIMKKSLFWLELVVMLVTPLPFTIGGVMIEEKVVSMTTINWADNSGQFKLQAHEYETPYLVTDFFLAFMLLRFYFFALAIIMFSPVNERLYGKRVCQEAGFEPNFTF